MDGMKQSPSRCQEYIEEQDTYNMIPHFGNKRVWVQT